MDAGQTDGAVSNLDECVSTLMDTHGQKLAAFLQRLSSETNRELKLTITASPANKTGVMVKFEAAKTAVIN